MFHKDTSDQIQALETKLLYDRPLKAREDEPLELMRTENIQYSDIPTVAPPTLPK